MLIYHIRSLLNLETGQVRHETEAGGLLGVGAGFHPHFSMKEALKSVYMVLNSRGITLFFPKTQIRNEHYFSIGQSWRARASETRDSGRGTAGFHSHFCL